MPKTYSDDEREYIKKRLREEAAYCLSAYGIRRTTVDTLIERVKIPKGTFYLFYESKELLLFEVLTQQHEILEKQMLDEIKSMQGDVTPDNLTETIYRFFKAVDESGLLRIIGTGEIELLYRKLPQEIIQDHFLHDTDMINRIIELLSLSPTAESACLSTAFRALFVSMVYKREIGEECFDEALKLTVRGLVLQMLE
ncbi:MAG TPA: TetR/AcrR family transcriptional regulator [Ruminococcaceae bacterium]|nr:TetR/AcrR family transcriptional regulator [Oscillospiraceae bacterium]